MRLESEQRVAFERKAEDLIEKALVLEQLNGTSVLEWKKVRDIPGIDTYSGDCKSQMRDRYFKGILSLPGHLKEGMDVIQTTNTAKYMYMMTELYESCLDAKVLHVIKKSSQQTLTIKYLVLDLPSASTNPRDFCFLEATGICVQEDGTEFGYCVMESIELLECPILPECFGVTRGVLTSTGMILRPSLTDLSLNICYSGAIDLCMSKESKSLFGTKPRFLLLHGLTKFLTLLETRRIEQKTLRNGSKCKSHAKTSRACALCYRKFHAFRQRRICRGCGEALCSKCCSKRTFRASSGDQVTTNVCVRCVLESRESFDSRISCTSVISSTFDTGSVRESYLPQDVRPSTPGLTREELNSLAKRFMDISAKSKETLSIVRHNTRLATGMNGIKVVTDSGDEIEPEPVYFAKY